MKKFTSAETIVLTVQNETAFLNKVYLLGSLVYTARKHIVFHEKSPNKCSFIKLPVISILRQKC